MLDFWYASYIFLGLSISIGLMVLLIIKKKEQRKRKQRDLKRALFGAKDEKEKTPLQELEEKYGKKG